jgi:N-methylhydantoinase A/oxoprolinase/acetone carboxylase beta subunit
MTEDRMALVELPRRAAPNLMESGRWPRRSTSGLAATARLRPLDADEVHRGIALLAVTGVEAIAVCFLHSRRHPTHERAVAALAEREFPGTAVSLSAGVVACAVV